MKEECEALNSEGLANQQRLESLTEEVASAKKLLEKAHKDNDRVRAELEEKEYMSGGTVLMWCVILDCQQSPLPHLTLAPPTCSYYTPTLCSLCIDINHLTEPHLHFTSALSTVEAAAKVVQSLSRQATRYLHDPTL